MAVMTVEIDLVVRDALRTHQKDYNINHRYEQLELFCLRSLVYTPFSNEYRRALIDELNWTYYLIQNVHQ